MQKSASEHKSRHEELPDITAVSRGPKPPPSLDSKDGTIREDSKGSNLETLAMRDVGNARASRRSRIMHCLAGNALLIFTMVGIVLGFGVGLGLQQAGASEDVLLYVGFPGELFLRALKATIVPLFVCMVITATSSVDARSGGKLAGVAVASFVITAALAVINATLLFFVLKPEANSLTQSGEAEFTTYLTTRDVFMDLVRNILPDNIVSATFSQTTTVYVEENVTLAVNETTNATQTVTQYTRSQGEASGVNIIGLITICAAVGAAARKTLPLDSAFLEFFRQGQEVTQLIMKWLVLTAPVGVASLMAQSIADVSDILSVIIAIARLVLCVSVGLAVHLIVVLPLLLALLTRKNPFGFLLTCARPFFVAFAAISSSIAIPQMVEVCDKNRISKSVTRFVIPMSLALHADGSALYMASASLFVAQTSAAGLLDGATVLVIAIMATVLSMAIPPVPSSSIVNVTIILTSINCPLNGIALLFTVEWILDRLRTGTNSASNVMCAAYTNALCGDKGNNMDVTTSSSDNIEQEEAVASL